MATGRNCACRGTQEIVRRGRNILYVSNRYTNTVTFKKLGKYKYLEDALNAIVDNSHIVLYDQVIDGDFTINGKTGITITSAPTPEIGRPVRFTGSITVRNSPHFRMAGITMSGEDAVLDIEVIEGAGVDNMWLGSSLIVTGSGYFSVANSYVRNMEATGEELDLHVQNCLGDASRGTWLMGNPLLNGTFERSSHCRIAHEGGNLIGIDLELSYPDSNGYAIVSNCPTGAGQMILISGTTMDTSGVLHPINKTGNCPYKIGLFDYATSGSTLTGTQISSPASRYYTAAEVDAIVSNLQGQITTLGTRVTALENG